MQFGVRCAETPGAVPRTVRPAGNRSGSHPRAQQAWRRLPGHWGAAAGDRRPIPISELSKYGDDYQVTGGRRPGIEGRFPSASSARMATTTRSLGGGGRGSWTGSHLRGFRDGFEMDMSGFKGFGARRRIRRSPAAERGEGLERFRCCRAATARCEACSGRCAVFIFELRGQVEGAAHASKLQGLFDELATFGMRGQQGCPRSP